MREQQLPNSSPSVVCQILWVGGRTRTCSITRWWLIKYCRRQIEKSPLAQIEMSLSLIFESDGEVVADDGDFDEPFGDRSDERSARSGGGANRSFGSCGAVATWASSGVSVGECVSAVRPCSTGVGSPRKAEQPVLCGGAADGGYWHHPRALCRLWADACGREACGAARH